MNKTALLHEAKQQQQALRQLSLWKRIAMLLSSCAAVLAWWGIAGSGLRFAGGVCGVVIALAHDVIITLESQLGQLKKQARQASRYRNLQDHIRRAEAILGTSIRVLSGREEAYY